MTRTALYRHYDAAGRLLYVGIADSLAKRDRQHSRLSQWQGDVRRTETEWFDRREDAATAEALAITSERPLHNVLWNNPDRDKADVRAIVAAIGSQTICEALAVTRHSVRFAITAGSFSASWYAGLLTLCAARGIDCPMRLFNWKPMVNSEKQGAAA